MKKLSITLGILLLTLGLSAQTTYNYTVDLQHIENDRVKIELLTPKITKNNTSFFFAKIIPGSYKVYDFGRLVKNFKAFDEQGNNLNAQRVDINTFKIPNSKKLHKITYEVDDSYDLTVGKAVSGMSGTNIEAEKNVVLNGHGFYGYFEGMKQLEYQIKILKPEGFEGASAENPISETPNYDVFKMPSYNFVVDTPMMYCRPDITTIKVANADVLVSVYSPSKNVTSEYISQQLENLLNAQKNYMGGKLPVDKYAFLMYFLSPGQNVGTGALEHNYSSLYALPDLPQEQIIKPILNISAHEFFHIITPLNIHSEEIHFFDFNNPKMSRHLWMYEGVTEYFAHHAQVVDDLTTTEEFLNEMANKITASMTNYNDTLSFTELSKECLYKHSDQYANVYQKGALIGMCLDILLRKSSNGKSGLIDLMNELAQKYGDNKPFKDRKLFKEIKKLTSPEIASFFKNHVDGNTPLPLEELLGMAGISYEAPKPYMGYSLGSPSLGYNPEKKRIYVADIGGLNNFGKKIGYQVGDELTSINGNKLPESGFHHFFQEITNGLKKGQTLKMEVERGGELVALTAVVEKVQLYKPASVGLDPNASQKQLSLRNEWLMKEEIN